MFHRDVALVAVDVSKEGSAGNEQARVQVGASCGNALTRNSEEKNVCTNHADQPTKQTATPYRLFNVASVEPLWLKMTHLKICKMLCSVLQSALCN